MRYNLEKYTGRSSRHQCPRCGDPHSFTYYIDNDTGQPAGTKYGRCNHESSCGYDEYPQSSDRIFTPAKKQLTQQPKLSIGYIPFEYVIRSIGYGSSFVKFLCGLFDRDTLDSPTVERLMNDYALGATKDGSIIYWQIDTKGKVRTGKIMKYDPETGHRVKDSGGINWVHAIMKRKGLLPEDFNLSQCLFGEHLLKMCPTKVVALVESEKTALIGSGALPDYIWLGVGGKSQLCVDKLKVLQGRTVIMFPDVDGFEYWTSKAKEIEAIGCKVIVSDLLEKNATDEDRANKIDIADWLIRDLLSNTQPEVNNERTGYDKTLQSMIETNPALQLLIDTFDLKPVA